MRGNDCQGKDDKDTITHKEKRMTKIFDSEFIKKFLAEKGAWRPVLEKPWIFEGKLYATNGDILIAISCEMADWDGELGDRGEFNESVAATFKDNPCTQEMDTGDFIALTEGIKIKIGYSMMVECGKCGGYGIYECRECGNDTECLPCDGTGKVKTVIETPLGGSIAVLLKTPVLFKGITFNAVYLRLVADTMRLSGGEWKCSQFSPETVAVFSNGEVSIALMPMRG